MIFIDQRFWIQIYGISKSLIIQTYFHFLGSFFFNFYGMGGLYTNILFVCKKKGVIEIKNTRGGGGGIVFKIHIHSLPQEKNIVRYQTKKNNFLLKQNAIHQRLDQQRHEFEPEKGQSHKRNFLFASGFERRPSGINEQNFYHTKQHPISFHVKITLSLFKK